MNFSYDALMRHLPQRRTTPVPFEEEEEEQQEILLLTAPPADWAGESIIASSISGWPAKKKIDGAGLAFEFYLQHGHFPHQAERLDDDSPFSSRSSTPALDDEVDTATSDEYLKKRRKRLEVEEDHYELLGLGHLRYKSTQKDIRDAYRKMVLLYHPDKGGDEATFKKIFKAHDTLSNENKKKIFDSSEHFNDYFPSDIPAGKDFYTVYSEVFERFSKWSVNKDIPSLGDDSTNLNMVNRFYKFWNNFQSWRDFSFDVEYDLEEADSREEKRWMEKQNKKGIEKLKKEERSKIVRLVETAYRLDPRVNKMKEAMEADALRRKKVREEAIRKLHEESEQKGAAERAQKEAEEQAKIKEAKDLERLKNKQLADLRKAKDRMRKVAYANNMNLEHLEKIFIEIKQAPALNALCQEIEIAFTTDAKEAHKLIISLIEDFRKKETEKYFDKKANGQKESRTGAPWSQEELAQLARAVTKIPAGVQRRWELISELIPSRTQDQIIAKVAETKMKRPEELTKEKNAAAAEAFALSQKQSTKGGDKIHIASAPSERLVEEEDEETKKKRLEEEEQKKKKLAEKKKRAAEAKKQKEEEERKKKEEEEAKIKAEEEKRRLKKEALKQKKIDDEKKKKEELAAAVEAKKLAEETKRAEAAAKKAAKKAAAAEAAVSAQAQIQIPSPSPSPAPVATTTTEAPKKPAAPKKSAAPKKAAAPKATPVVEAPKVKSFSAAAGGVNAIPDANSPINWSPQQQKALEQALAKYPTSLGAARWDKIAAEVPEKTRKECVDRFKYLSQAVKAKQQKA